MNSSSCSSNSGKLPRSTALVFILWRSLYHQRLWRFVRELSPAGFTAEGNRSLKLQVLSFPMELTMYFTFVHISKLLIHAKATITIQLQSSFKRFWWGFLSKTIGKSKSHKTRSSLHRLLSLLQSSYRLAMPNFLHISSMSLLTARLSMHPLAPLFRTSFSGYLIKTCSHSSTHQPHPLWAYHKKLILFYEQENSLWEKLLAQIRYQNQNNSYTSAKFPNLSRAYIIFHLFQQFSQVCKAT